jgi:hypothetical protein
MWKEMQCKKENAKRKKETAPEKKKRYGSRPQWTSTHQRTMKDEW